MEAPRCQWRFSARLRRVKRKQSPADQPEAEQKAKHKDNKSKQSFEEETEEENAKHGGKQFNQFSDEHLDRWIWTAKRSMTWRQFYDQNG